MKPSKTRSVSRDSVLARLMDDYLASCEQGAPLSPDDLARRFPELADDVEACLTSLDFIRKAAGGEPACGAAVSAALKLELTDENDERAGAGTAPRLGDFRIIREVGRGGMGVVYEAEQISLARRVALKVLPFAAVLDAKQLQRFKNEALAAAQLDHPHIVDVVGVGQDRGTHFYAMRFIDGQTLAELVDRERQSRKARGREGERGQAADTDPIARSPTLRLASSPALGGYRPIATVIADAADALHHAHEQGVIHRDIKPSNLILDGRGKIWVTDFGLAHVENNATLTMTGDFLGTLRYMSPEQASGSRLGVDHRTDVYSLGATLYELLTLRPLFEGDDRPSLLHRVAHEEPRPPRSLMPSVPAELETIILKAIDKNPAERYPTAAELASDLRRYVANQPIRARRPGAIQIIRKWAARHAALVTLGVAASLLLAVVTSLAAVLLWHERGQTAAALTAAKQHSQTAEIRRQQAETMSESVRQRLYAADIRLAFKSFASGDLKQASMLLLRHLPATDQTDIRGFEWHYLWRLCHDERLILNGHKGEVYAANFSPDGKRLITGGEDRTTRIWDVATGRQLLQLPAHGGAVRAAIYSPDGTMIATASDDFTVKLWNAVTGELVDTLAEHRRELRAIAFSPDGRYLASGGLDDTAQLWNLESGQLEAIFYGHIRGVRGVAFSPDGSWLVTGGGDHELRVWDTRTRMQKALLHGNPSWVCCVDVSPDGSLIANGIWGPEMSIWDAASGQQRQIPAKHTNWVHRVAFSRDGKSFLSASRDGTVRVWDVAAAESTRLIAAHQAPVLWASWPPDERLIATAGADGLVKLWDNHSQAFFTAVRFDVPTRRELINGSSTLQTIRPGGQEVAFFTSLDRTLQVLDVRTGKFKTLTLDGDDDLAFRSMALSPDERFIATGARDGIIEIWDSSSGQRRMRLEGHSTLVHNVAFSPNGRWLASGESVSFGAHEGGTRLWDLTTGKQLWEARCIGGAVADIAFSPDGRHVAVNDGQIWHVPDGRLYARLEEPIGPIRHISYSPDGKLIATGDVDGLVKVWDAATGRLQATLLGHAKAVGGLAFSPDGRTLVSTGYESTIRLWHVATGQELAVLSTGETEGGLVTFCDGGSQLACLAHRQLLFYSAHGTGGQTIFSSSLGVPE